MATFILVLLIALGLPVILLILNKGEKAIKIKESLAEIWVNLKDLFTNIQTLFKLLRELIPSNDLQGLETSKDQLNPISPTDQANNSSQSEPSENALEAQSCSQELDDSGGAPSPQSSSASDSSDNPIDSLDPKPLTEEENSNEALSETSSFKSEEDIPKGINLENDLEKTEESKDENEGVQETPPAPHI